jgi:hypothetical protein
MLITLSLLQLNDQGKHEFFTEINLLSLTWDLLGPNYREKFGYKNAWKVHPKYSMTIFTSSIMSWVEGNLFKSGYIQMS